MSCAEKLEQIAKDLIKSDSRWFKGNRHYFKVLQAFIRDKGLCAYCKKNLWKEFGTASCGDHLLPRALYPGRAEDVDNLVPACADCNAIKRDADPSKEEGQEIVIAETAEITEEVRQMLIGNARKQIKRKMESDDWRNEFEAAKRLFDEAVAKYRAWEDAEAGATMDNGEAALTVAR